MLSPSRSRKAIPRGGQGARRISEHVIIQSLEKGFTIYCYVSNYIWTAGSHGDLKPLILLRQCSLSLEKGGPVGLEPCHLGYRYTNFMLPV